MSLPVPNLDNRHFQDIVDDAKRLIPTYLPQWTNHNVSDPGVALIELFAWMSEMIIYRLNQTPDKLYTQFLNLLGVRPFPARAATADLTFWLSATTDQVVTVEKGIVVSGIDTEATPHRTVEFATTADLRIEQPVRTAALRGHGETGLDDVLDDLQYVRQAVRVFADIPEVDDCFYLGFANSLAGHVLQLDVTAVPHGVGIRPESPPVAWEVWSGPADGWVRCDLGEDTTGGLNRNGMITLYVPAKHELLTLEEKRAFWLRVRYRRAVGDQPTYRHSPEVLGLNVATVGGTVVAEHSVTVPGEVIGRSNGRPAQQFKLRHRSNLPRIDGETIRVTALEGELLTTELWTEVEDFSRSARKDRHFVWDDSEGVITFGPEIRYPDGTMRQHGHAPPDGARIEVTSYRHGGGLVGNLPAGAINRLHTGLAYIARVGNRAPSVGGVEAETYDNVKDRGPMTLRTGQRAVTPSDYERLTLENRQVNRARCLRPTVVNGPVRVLLVPAVDKPPGELEIDDFQLRDSLFHAVANHLDECRVLGTEIEVTTPFYVGVSVAALVRPVPGRSMKVVEDAVMARLHQYLDPRATDDGDGWPWETTLTTASLQAVISDVDGVVSVDQVVLFAADLRKGRRIGEPVQSFQLNERSLFLGFRHQVVVK